MLLENFFINSLKRNSMSNILKIGAKKTSLQKFSYDFGQLYFVYDV